MNIIILQLVQFWFRCSISFLVKGFNDALPMELLGRRSSTDDNYPGIMQFLLLFFVSASTLGCVRVSLLLPYD